MGGDMAHLGSCIQLVEEDLDAGGGIVADGNQPVQRPVAASLAGIAVGARALARGGAGQGDGGAIRAQGQRIAEGQLEAVSTFFQYHGVVQYPGIGLSA